MSAAPKSTGRRAARGADGVLAGAAEVVAERGVEGTRFADVARRTGRSVSTLQYLFGNREDLVVQALRAGTNQMLSTARQQVLTTDDPLDRLLLLASHLAGHGQEATARTEWMLWVEYWRAALRDPTLFEEGAAAYDGWLALVRDAVRSAVDAGVVAPVDDVDDIARAVCALADGLGVQIALERPGMTWDRARSMVRAYLATRLACPALLTPEGPADPSTP